MSWRAARLGDVLTLKRGHDLPDAQRQDGDVPVVSSSGITGHHSEPKAKAPGVVTGRYGTLGEVFYIEEDYWPLNTALYITDFKGNRPRFVAYFLQSVLRNYQSDKAAVPGVNRNVLHEIKVRCPDPKVQDRIADILSAYDDLIENNRRRMALLEDAARQLYREWFVRLRFPGHEHTRITNGVPEGWERNTLGDRVTLNYGKALKAEVRVEGPCPVYGSSGIVGMHEKALAVAPGIAVGRKGNVGSVYWCPKDYWPIDTAYFIDAETSNLWLFYALKHMHFISTDVAVPGLNRDFAYSRPLLVPEPRIVRDFLETAAPLHEQIAKLDEMNDKLRAARDLLLPRLMSGEIAV
jgi:type I restriction enzyme S subunit